MPGDAELPEGYYVALSRDGTRRLHRKGFCAAMTGRKLDSHWHFLGQRVTDSAAYDVRCKRCFRAGESSDSDLLDIDTEGSEAELACP